MSKEKYGFVYIWRDRKRKRYYIGSHWGTEEDGYICSSKWMRDAHRTRPQDFKRRILSRHETRKEMFEEEERVLNLIRDEELSGVRYYNIVRHTFHHWSHDPEKLRSMSERISERNKGTTITFKDPEGRKAKIIATKAAKPYAHSEELRQQMSNSRKGKSASLQSKLKKSKTYLVLDPEGYQYIIVNLPSFCAERGLDKANIRRKYGSKGWRVVESLEILNNLAQQ